MTKTYFPREVIVISQVGARFVDFLAASLVLAGMLVWYGIAPTPWLLLVPVLLVDPDRADPRAVADHLGAERLVPRPGAGRDARPPGLALRDPGRLLARWRGRRSASSLWPLYVLNPMVGLIDAFRAVIAHGRAPDWELLAISTDHPPSSWWRRTSTSSAPSAFADII